MTALWIILVICALSTCNGKFIFVAFCNNEANDTTPWQRGIPNVQTDRRETQENLKNKNCRILILRFHL